MKGKLTLVAVALLGIGCTSYHHTYRENASVFNAKTGHAPMILKTSVEKQFKS